MTFARPQSRRCTRASGCAAGSPCVHRKATSRHFTDERLRLLEGLAYRASVALQKSTLLQSEQASAEVASTLLEFSRRLAGVSGAG